MPYKLILSDLDGTFLNDGPGLNIDLRIPKNNIEAIRIMNEKKIMFALASGRSYHSLDYFYNALSLKGQGVCGISFNGSIVYEIDNLNPLRTVLLKNELMRECNYLLHLVSTTLFPYSPIEKSEVETEQIRLIKCSGTEEMEKP
jgi:hydroxymethylpyrimidine pyrophosphatase-like HAD family hydrolase